MKYMYKKLLVSAVLTGALWSGAALAQSAPGSEGSGETPRSAFGEGAELPRGATAMPTPKFSADELDRDLELDPERLREGFGTVSRSRTGEETREPPSEELLRSLEPTAGEFDRQVFGDDDRVQVTDSSAYPFRAFGLLVATNAEGDHVTCSGTLIGPRTVLTAAHCLYDHDQGGWLDNFLFAPGLLSIDNAPFGAWAYETAYIFEGYLTNYKGFYGSVVPWDIAVLVLEQPIGDQLGWLGYGHEPQLGNFHANIIGYPGDKPAGTMWRADCEVPRANVDDQTFHYFCDTYPGSSGASVYRFDPATQDRLILGVNVAESPQANFAVRINETYFNWVQSLVK